MFVERAKKSIWTLPVPLQDYIHSFEKEKIIYERDLQTAKQDAEFLHDWNLFEWEVPGVIKKNTQGLDVTVDHTFDAFFEKNTDKPWNWY